MEARLEKGRGSVSTVLIQSGTLKVGDIFVAGNEWGKVRALIDDHGHKISQALPSCPVEVIGFDKTPLAGDDFVVVESESKAREISDFRSRRKKDALSAAKVEILKSMFDNVSLTEKKELSVVIKSDVGGSLEAISASLNKLTNDEVVVKILYGSVGGITESDITLAKASQALVVGFNVRANPQARDLAKRDNIEVRYYSIIYDVIDDVKAILSGMLSPILKENYLGSAQMRQIFQIPKVGKIAGCMITDGVVKRGETVRLLRENVVIHEGTLKTLKRFKDEVKEAREGFECGMAFENYSDIREGDIVECFEIQEIKRSL
jgi:translation initiation factor IF-2